MAYVKNNAVITGLSGKFGKELIFRQAASGKTVLVSPADPPKGPGSAAQQERRGKFQWAVVYAQGVNADPEAKEAYQAKATPGKSAYNVAVADFMNAPDIEEINISGYTGQPDQLITIKVTDDFKVKAVRLSIQNADGTLVEEGEAVPDTDGQTWLYTTTAVNDNLEGDKIIIAATDIPDNLTMVEKTFG